jgi:hypothetical protein
MADSRRTEAQNNAYNSVGITNSRLLSGSETLRKQLIVRNLYAPDTEYPLPNEMYINNVVDSISTIINGITPFKSYNLKNTVYGRLVSNPTPLTEIGLMMLGKQFALNSMSHLAQQTFPVIKIANMFDGNKNTHLFTFHKDMRITKQASDTTFENFLDKIYYTYPTKDNPFTKDPSNSDYIKNSGTGQLSFLYQAINQNPYKQNDNTLIAYGNVVKNPLQPRSTLIAYGTKTYFNFDMTTSYPYLSQHPSSLSTIDADNAMIDSANVLDKASTEYAPTIDFVKENFGTSNKSAEYDDGVKGSFNDWIDPSTEFSKDDIKNKLVWGRDGVSDKAKAMIAPLHGDLTEETINNVEVSSADFKIKGGLLEYTRNLLNASEGNYIDITRKAFTNNKKLVGFNGSGLWRANYDKYAQRSGTAGKQGVRQHTVLDQYNRFAKAIRFNGNGIYGGSPDSVIFNSVLPRIHPTLDEKTGTVNNKNLMFSIENLAVRIINNGTYGIMDDEWGSPVPICEVGPFGGRIMWFPPYNMTVNEVATAKYEPTVMVGRNEPMYNYMNSERSATINFTLLVDYPQQLKDLVYKGTNKQEIIASFFAFGGNGYKIPDLVTPSKPSLPDTDTTGPTTLAPTDLKDSEELRLVFPNDIPKAGDDLTTIVNQLWGKKYYYEIMTGFISSDGTGFGLNSDTFVVSGVTEYMTTGGSTQYRFTDPNNLIDQYSSIQQSDQFGEVPLNKILFDTFNDEANRNLYSVYVYGSASKLFTENIKSDVYKGEAHNLALGKRRADAAIWLIKQRLINMFGQGGVGIEVTYDPKKSAISGVTGSLGDTQSSPDNATKVAIPEEDTKNERCAIIQIRRNEKERPPKEPQLSNNDKKAVADKQKEIEATETKKKEIKRAANNCVLNQRGTVDENGVGDTGILNGFQSISGNYFYPVFHSQTPEDFHKRLTFLHQCTRQGAARRHNTEIDKTGTVRARNSVFGRQPICILRVGDFFYTKVIIETVNIDYNDTTWDTNPEGFGMQPMIANVTLQLKLIGGQSLKGPIDALQNAVAFNYYANSTFTDTGLYKLPSKVADQQASYINGILTAEQRDLINERVSNALTLAMKGIFR